MRAGRAAVAALVAALAGAAPAQEAPTGVAVIDQNRLLTDSAMGRALEARFDAASRDLAAENRRIEGELEAEERALTAARAGTPPAEFQKLAARFDEKVEGIRRAQEAKSRALSRQRDEDRQKLIQRAVPVLAQLAQARGAAVLLDRAGIVLSLGQADITDEAIAELDAMAAEPPAPAP